MCVCSGGIDESDVHTGSPQDLALIPACEGFTISEQHGMICRVRVQKSHQSHSLIVRPRCMRDPLSGRDCVMIVYPHLLRFPHAHNSALYFITQFMSDLKAPARTYSLRQMLIQSCSTAVLGTACCLRAHKHVFHTD